ncbi:MAG: transporter related protein [Haloplasmataceae bacterium]|jgi:multiple sugar transport system ATP-binding protein|nr:transporter related protein [Haloplasmataceae bacterium]
MADLILSGVNKIYPNGVQAVFDFCLDIKDGEFIVLVGPSGCGKSTTLRMIAGLEGISSGDLILDGVKINDKAPSNRDITMVFQDYALYGNMTVYENMGFSLTVRKEKSDKIHDAVMDISKIIGLNDYLNRLPARLSGGQRQRVALGRSIVRNAKVFLMDEPLSNLDAQLRQQTRKEIVVLHNKLNATIVYVTHDQVEAMTMATRIVVMNNGYVQQVGTPFEVYNNPDNMFVGGFIGTPPMNFLQGTIKGNYFIVLDEKETEVLVKLEIPNSKLNELTEYNNKAVALGFRAEHLFIENEKLSLHKESAIKGIVDVAELLGSEILVKVCVGKNKFIAKINSNNEVYNGQSIILALDMNKVHFFDIDTLIRIRKLGGKNGYTEQNRQKKC